jgi:hypothetical protein
MSIFGLYFTKNMLIQMNWPRKQGLFGKEVIDTTIFDSTVNQMIDWAAALGAGKPKLSLQIISYMFKDKDWDGTDRPKIKQFIEGMNQKHKKRRLNLEETAPHDIVQPAKMANYFGATVEAKSLQDQRIVTKLETEFLSGLLYGLGNPSSFESWYKNHMEDMHNKMPIMKKAGLDIDEPLSLDENYANSEQIIRDYEKSMEITLPSIPENLLLDAKDLGIKVN